MNPSEPLLYETHMHTPLCKHAEGTPEAYALAAKERGLDGIIVTCHTPLPNGMHPAVRMSPEEWPEYVDLVGQARKKMEGEMDVRLGLEVDFFPGLEFWYEDLLAREPLHYVLGSVHPYSLYKEMYFTGDWHAYHKQYFTSLVESAESGYFDCLAHPDLIKNWGIEEYDLQNLLDHIRCCLDRIAETGIAMELNTSGVNKLSGEMNPSPGILREMRTRDIPVVVGSDAHSPDRVAADFLEAFDLLESVGYDHTHIFLDRKKRKISLRDARAKLNRSASP